MVVHEPYMDAEGNPVTITLEQCAAVFHALDVWFEVRKQEGYWTEWNSKGVVDPEAGVYDQPWWQMHAEISKSCLLGRLLYEGKPLTELPPPIYMSAPVWQAVEEEMECAICHEKFECLPHDDPRRNLTDVKMGSKYELAHTVCLFPDWRKQ